MKPEMIIIARPPNCRKNGFFASDQCKIRYIIETGDIKRQANPQRILVLNAAIRNPTPPMIRIKIPIYAKTSI
jgi:hypothetical protein